MNLHEYQAKELLKKYNVPVQEGLPVDTPEKAEEAYKQLKVQTGNNFAVVKAQIHAGGRGKGKIKGSEQRGVAVGKSADDIKQIAQNILGGTLITIQTGPAGKVVNKVLVAQDVYYPGPNPVKEFYLSILLDRAKGQNVVMYSTEGGMNIEDVAHDTPEKIFREWVHPSGGLQPFQARKIAFNLGLAGEAFKSCIKFVTSLYNAYVGLDCSMLEINPLFKTSDEKIIAVDCKMNIDDNALMRHADIEALRDISEEDHTEVEAAQYNLNFIKLDGNVGCMVNGAGLAMATMDMIKHAGGEPANFLDIGGGATPDRVAKAFRLVLSDEKVEAILVNIFAGINRCDWVAEGVVAAFRQLEIKIPVVVRLSGTNVEAGNRIIAQSGLPIVTASTLAEAAEKAVAALRTRTS
ncbi:MAG: ADP-forming succinate--CoA ligase subunit beta [Bacteroidia bacterium]|nr:ADP-forming succinate--CoA ligase subunit beta [Bacteroidia bacterium]